MSLNTALPTVSLTLFLIAAMVAVLLANRPAAIKKRVRETVGSAVFNDISRA